MTSPQPLSCRLSLVQGISNHHSRRNQERMLETLLGQLDGMAYLKSFPADHLKVDRPFATNLATSEKDQSIYKAIVSLGHNLGLRVVVEGVESSEQYHLLHDIGCNEVPGLDLLLITINLLWLLDSR
jgi:hypothetical protein